MRKYLKNTVGIWLKDILICQRRVIFLNKKILRNQSRNCFAYDGYQKTLEFAINEYSLNKNRLVLEVIKSIENLLLKIYFKL